MELTIAMILRRLGRTNRGDSIRIHGSNLYRQAFVLSRPEAFRSSDSVNSYPFQGYARPKSANA
jgi:hypothetical protein